MSAINPVNTTPYEPLVSTASTAPLSSSISTSPNVRDEVELSLAGRIALGVGSGRLTSDQAQQLAAQLKTINQDVQSGDTNVAQSLHQLSEQIYGDGHNGAAIPTGLTVTRAAARDFDQAGRIVTQERAGNLTSTQASQLFAQMKQIQVQSQNGASAATINQAQNELSIQIYDTAHNVTPGT